LQEKKTPKPLSEEGSLVDYLSPAQNNILLFFACLLTIFPPLFYVSVAPGSFDEGFGAMRILNGELKYVSFLFIVSPLIGLFGVFVHFRRRLLALDRGMLACLVLFLGGVLLSTVTAHNIDRAWVATLKWHLLPLLLAFTLAHLHWNRYRILAFLGIALAVACSSGFLVLDQHYGFTEWGPRLPRNGSNLGALLYNQNMAAEYHVPFLPIALGLLFYTRSLALRVILFLLISFILLPALTLSLARGAWVGLLVGGIVVVTSAGTLLFLRRNRLGEFFRPCFFRVVAFLGLTLALPLYIYTTPYWKKSDESGQVVAPQKEAEELASIIPRSGGGVIHVDFFFGRTLLQPLSILLCSWVLAPTTTSFSFTSPPSFRTTLPKVSSFVMFTTITSKPSTKTVFLHFSVFWVSGVSSFGEGYARL
jgi:hypothetical protein